MLMHRAPRFAKLAACIAVVLSGALLPFPGAAMEGLGHSRAFVDDTAEHGLHAVMPPGPWSHDRLVKAVTSHLIR